MKMSGADFQVFLKCKDPNIWPPGLYIEEELLRVNGVETELAESYSDADVIEIISGSLAWENLEKSKNGSPGSLRALARKWLKIQSSERVVVLVPKGRISDLSDALKPLGATIWK